MKQCALLGLPIGLPRCQRPALDDPQAKGFCILHAPWDGKDLSAFQAAIDEIIEKAREGNGVCDFSHCYFPPSYNCWNLKQAFEFSCNFTGAQFAGEADFGGAKFSGDADFWGAEFSGDANFWRAEFRQRADFSGVETAKDATVYFREVSLLKPQQVFFHHVDLSRWSFLDTDLRRIDFNDVTWGTIRRLWSRRTAIFDEIRVSNEKVKVPKEYLAKVERLYRHLKQNYESQRDYGRAGDFYYGEMEMKRRQLNPLGQIPFWIYRILSGYGESYPRALFWLIVMWLLFAVLFTVVGYSDEWGNHADLWRSLIYSAQSMTLFHELNITFHSAWGKAIKLVASVLGVIQIALFGLALQRRFKR
jgi:hypothetical protein